MCTAISALDHRTLDVFGVSGDIAIPGLIDVVEIRRATSPLWMIASLGECILPLGNIRAAQVQQWQLFHLLAFLHCWHNYTRPLFLHLADDPAEQLCRGIGTQSPAGIHVANRVRHVWQILEHCVFPEELLAHVEWFAINRYSHSACELHLQTSSRHNDVRMQFLPVFQLDSIGADIIDDSRDDVRLPVSQRLIVIAVRAEANPLFEWNIRRLEVGILLDFDWKLGNGGFPEQVDHKVGKDATHADHDISH